MVKFPSRGCLFGLCLLRMDASSCVFGRPTNFQEIDKSKFARFLAGTLEGFETVRALMGFYGEGNEKDFKNDFKNDRFDNDRIDNSATTIQVAVLGLGRTGTTSLALAMETLGYRVIHDDEHVLLTDIYHLNEEEEITDDEFHEIAGRRGFNATFKTGKIWVSRHPEVRAILTVRDSADSYVASWTKAAKFHEYIRLRPYRWMATVRELMPSFDAEYLDEPTSGDPAKYLDEETLRNGYASYITSVREMIPEERLLVFNVKQGWEPLCRFLEKPVPEGVPFPHVHDRVKLQGEMFVIYLITWIWPLAIVLPLLVPAFLFFRHSRHSR